jgi:hypothetical protein
LLLLLLNNLLVLSIFFALGFPTEGTYGVTKEAASSSFHSGGFIVVIGGWDNCLSLGKVATAGFAVEIAASTGAG